MSLNEKYTQEELGAIPPFTGFHHNKTKQELINEASDALRNCDKINSFAQVNLWDFEPLTKPAIKFDYPEINKDVAEAFDMVVEKFKEENQPREVIQNIVDKIHERRLSGKECQVAIISYSDYDAIQSMNDFETHSVWISGCLLKIHASQNLKDGEIEIY